MRSERNGVRTPMGRHRRLLGDGDPGPIPRVARDRHGHADAGRSADLRGGPRAGTNCGDAHRFAGLLDVPDRTARPERGRVHPDRPQVERALPREPALPRGVLRRHRGRDARRVPAPEPVRPRHPGDPSSAVRRRVASPGGLPPGGVVRVIDHRLRGVDALQGHEDDLAVLGSPDESLRHRAARILSDPVHPDRVAVRRPAPPDQRRRGARQQCGRSRDDQRKRGDPRGGGSRGGIRRHVRLRNLLGPEDGPGALTMAVEVNLAAQPQKGRVLAAWGLIGWRWIWRSPAAAIVPLLQPFFFLYFLHLISDPSYFPLQVAGAMIFSTQNIGSWCLSDSAVFRIELRLQDIFVASPHDKVRYLFGVAFSNMIPALPALVALGIILAIVTPVSLTAWLVIVACILTIWVLYSAIGIAVSSRLRSQREVWPVGNLIFTLLGILSPLYYPLSRLPPVWRELAQVLPATYAALLVQGVLGLEPAAAASLAVDAGLLILSTAVGLVLAWRLYQWRER